MKYPETITKLFGKLRVDMKTAAEEICTFFLTEDLLRCDSVSFYLNCGTHAQRTSREEMSALVYCFLNPQQAAAMPTRAVEEAIKRLLLHPSVKVDAEENRQRSEHVVNMKNGQFDISTGQFSEKRVEILADYILNFNYIPKAQIEQARTFLSFLNSSLSRGYLDCVLRILGYLVSSLTQARKAFLLLGKGATGKSTILEMTEAVVGKDQCSHVPFHRIGNIHARAEYAGKRLNVSRDNSDVPMKDEDGFKNLVSCETTTGRRLYENAVDFVPRLKLIFASNVDLNFKHPDDAVFDRLLVIPFTKEIPPEKRDLNLLEKLMEERDIIFSAALNTLPDLVKSGFDFHEPDACKRIIERYRAALHTADSFLADCCELKENGSVSSVQLFRRYTAWCAENGIDADGQKTFYSRVRAYDARIKDSKVYHNGVRVNGFRGIALRLIDENDDKSEA